MNAIVRQWCRLYDTIRNTLPRNGVLWINYPTFVFFEWLATASGLPLDYRGGGRFETDQQLSDRDRGWLEAIISIAPIGVLAWLLNIGMEVIQFHTAVGLAMVGFVFVCFAVVLFGFVRVDVDTGLVQDGDPA